jgi:hypothetical protein
VVAKDQQQTPRQKTPKTPTKTQKADGAEKNDQSTEKPKIEVFKKFYVTYAFGHGCEGKVMNAFCAQLLARTDRITHRLRRFHGI